MYNKIFLFITPPGRDINRIPRKRKPKALPPKPSYFVRYVFNVSCTHFMPEPFWNTGWGVPLRRWHIALYLGTVPLQQKSILHLASSQRRPQVPLFISIHYSGHVFNRLHPPPGLVCVQVPLQPLELNHGAFK